MDYPFNHELDIDAEAKSLVAWIKWQLVTLTATDVADALHTTATRWVINGYPAPQEHKEQVSGLLYWWVGGVVAEVMKKGHGDGLGAAYALLRGMRCSQAVNPGECFPDYTELMEDQVTMMDPTIPEWEEVA